MPQNLNMKPRVRERNFPEEKTQLPNSGPKRT